MTYVKRRGMVLLVDDTQVAKYTGEGFEVYTPPAAPEKPEKKPKKPAEGKEPPAAPEAGEDDGNTGK